MIELPDDVVHKIEWAEALVRELHQVELEYLASAPVTLYPAREPAGDTGGLLSWSTRCRVDVLPSARLSLLAGDVVQNTRAALDYLAQALVLSTGGTPIEGIGGTQFPIALRPPKGELRIAGCKSGPVLDDLVLVQPFRASDPSSHPLARLNALNNVNKHRALPLLTSAGAVPAVVALHTAASPVRGTISAFLRWFFDGDRLDPIIGLFEPGEQPVVSADYAPIVSLSGDAWQAVGLVQELDYYLRHVRDVVIPTFRRHFAEPWPSDVFSPESPDDPFARLPEVTPAALRTKFLGVVEHVTGGESHQMITLGLVPGMSIAMGYEVGGTPHAGAFHEDFRPTTQGLQRLP